MGLTDEDDPSGGQAPRQKHDSAGYSSCDPRGADTDGHIDLLVGDVARRIAMDEIDFIGDAEFFSAEFRLFGEQLAHVDAGAEDAVITCPEVHSTSPEPLPRSSTRAPSCRRNASPRGAELFGCERVMDAVSPFGDVEDPWNVHFGNLLMGVNRLGHRLTIG